METLITVLGCMASFLLGAHVRKPFLLFRQRAETEDEKRAEESEDTEQKERLKKQWENLLLFNGEEQAGE